MKLLRLLHYCCVLFTAAVGGSLFFIPRTEWLPFLILAAVASALPLLGHAVVAQFALVQLRRKHRELEKGALTDPLPTQWEDLTSLAQNLSELQNQICRFKDFSYTLSIALCLGACAGIAAQQIAPPAPKHAPITREFGPKRAHQNRTEPESVGSAGSLSPASNLFTHPTEAPSPIPTAAMMDVAPSHFTHTPNPQPLESPTAIPIPAIPSPTKARPTRRPSPAPSATSVTPWTPTTGVISGPFTSTLR